MNIYLISQTEVRGWDTYDSAVVVAVSEADAQKIHPSGYEAMWEDGGNWASKPTNVKVEYIGMAKDGLDACVICSSFNAG